MAYGLNSLVFIWFAKTKTNCLSRELPIGDWMRTPNIKVVGVQGLQADQLNIGIFIWPACGSFTVFTFLVFGLMDGYSFAT